jgi:glutaconate CoA-transferase subunit A
VAGIGHGATVAVGGLTTHRRPVGLCCALARRAQGITVAGVTLSLETEILLAAGAVSTIRSSMVSLEVFGLAPLFRDAAEAGTIDIVEETEGSFTLALLAARAGLPFIPWPYGDALESQSRQTSVTATTSDGRCRDMKVIPAWSPDVALIHAVAVDVDGNAHLGSNVALDVEIAEAATSTIVSAERIVERGTLERIDLWGPAVDVFVEAPCGAFPTSCHPLYPVAGRFLLEWLGAEGDRTRLVAELAEMHGLRAA